MIAWNFAIPLAVEVGAGIWLLWQRWKTTGASLRLDEREARLRRLERDLRGTDDHTLLAEKERQARFYMAESAARLDTIYRYEKQRDDWKRRFHRSVEGHATAVEMLSKTLQQDRKLLMRGWTLVNKMRAERNEEPLKLAADIVKATEPLSPPAPLALEYILEMKKIFEAADKDIDVRTELRMHAALAASAQNAACDDASIEIAGAPSAKV